MKVKLRSFLTASPGHVLISMDFSQAETWVVAYLANEPSMKHSLKTSDVHRDTAAFALFNCRPEDVTPVMRYTAKRCNHALSYRMGPERAAQVINSDSDAPPYLVVTNKQTKEFAAKWLQYYKGINNWWLAIDECMARNRTIITTYGRKRVFFGQYGKELAKEMTAFEPQSTVADHCNGRVHPQLNIEGGLRGIYNHIVVPKLGSIVNQSHDSVIVETPLRLASECAAIMYKEMYRPLIIKDEQFYIPVDCEMGERWGELQEVEI